MKSTILEHLEEIGECLEVINLQSKETDFDGFHLTAMDVVDELKK